MLAPFGDIERFAKKCLSDAKLGAEDIQFSILESEHYSMGGGNIRAEAPHHIGNTPRFKDLPASRGAGGWAVILAVDLRGSSKRAVEIGAEDTYVTMHTYLPTMAELVSRADGKVGSLRGDGLFGVFGFTEYERNKPRAVVTKEAGAKAIRNATRCGKAMVEAITDILNPILVDDGIKGELQIGVGICVGDVVMTNIGIGDATEKTLYGAPVNHACKASNKGVNQVILTNQAEAIYPQSKGGKLGFRPIPLAGQLGGQLLIPHAGFVMLERKGLKNAG